MKSPDNLFEVQYAVRRMLGPCPPNPIALFETGFFEQFFSIGMGLEMWQLLHQLACLSVLNVHVTEDSTDDLKHNNEFPLLAQETIRGVAVNGQVTVEGMKQGISDLNNRAMKSKYIAPKSGSSERVKSSPLDQGSQASSGSSAQVKGQGPQTSAPASSSSSSATPQATLHHCHWEGCQSSFSTAEELYNHGEYHFASGNGVCLFSGCLAVRRFTRESFLSHWAQDHASESLDSISNVRAVGLGDSLR